MLEIALIVLLALGHALSIIQSNAEIDPLPLSGPKAYARWKGYNAEKNRLDIISTSLSFAIMLVLIVTDAYSAVAQLLPANIYTQMTAVLLFDSLLTAVISVGFKYVETMKIGQRYGFNRSTVKAFVFNQIKALIKNTFFDLLLGFALAFIYQWLESWIVLLFVTVILGFSPLISFVYPVFSRIGHKFTPLPDGELKDRLIKLFEKHDYKVKTIEVMDNEQEATELNADFTGSGKLKSIVLCDNLINNMSVDEICAVFSYELEHGLQRDVLDRQIINIGTMLLLAVIV